MNAATKWLYGLGPKPDHLTDVTPVVHEAVYPVHRFALEIAPYSDRELTDMVNHWIDHYTKNGERHYKDTKDYRIVEIYWESIIERVANELIGTDAQVDAFIERIHNLF